MTYNPTWKFFRTNDCVIFDDPADCGDGNSKNAKLIEPFELTTPGNKNEVDPARRTSRHHSVSGRNPRHRTICSGTQAVAHSRNTSKPTPKETKQ